MNKIPNRSGRIWRTTAAKRIARVKDVCSILRASYGMPQFGNPTDPLDDLIYVIVSTRTSLEVAQRVFTALKTEYRVWDEVLATRRSKLRRILRPAGLSEKKS